MRQNSLNMNAGIIMSGQQPDIVNTLAQSSRAAGITNRVQRENQLHQAYQEHGPGIMAGDQTALNALSQQNLPQAFNILQSNRREDRLDQQAALTEREFEFRIQQWSQKVDAAELEREIEEQKQFINAASAADSPERWDQILTELGGDDASGLMGQFHNKDALLRKYATSTQIMEANRPQSAPGKVAADIEAGHLPEGTPLRGQGTTVNVGAVQQSAEAGVVDTSTIEPSGKFSTATPDATGTSGLIKGGVNTVGEAIGAGQAFPEVDKAQTALTSLSTRSMLGLSEEFPGRPSNLTRERIEALTVKPSEITTGPGRALNKTRDMVATIQESIDAANAVLLDTIYSQKDKAQAKTALRQLSQLYADYKGLEQSLAGSQEGKKTTSSGITYEVLSE